MTINANSHDPAPRTPAEQARRNTALAAAKAAAAEMVKNVIAALREDLHTLDWMSPA